MRLRLIGCALLLLAAPLLPAGPVHAATPATSYWYGTVTAISDGDTIYVDIAGDGIGSVPVRNAGIQATEMHGGNGLPECHAVQATALMARLVPVGSRVRLAAWYASSTSGTDPNGVTRLLRYVDAYDPQTRQYDIDVQLELLKAGLVMWEPIGEMARVASYHLPMQRAMASRLGLFDTNACREGPLQGTPMPMWVHYDADGDDAVLNGEWIALRNRGSYDVPLAGWHLRDSSHSFYHDGTYFTFPARAVVRAGQTITIYAGPGTDDVATGRYHLDRPTGMVFPNVTDPATGYPGKAVYLLDPDLDFRGWSDYPCLTNCVTPPVHIARVQYRGEEYVDLRLDASATSPVDLTAYTGVEVTNDGWTKQLMPGTVLAPGETLRVWCQRGGTDTRLRQHWRHTGYMFEDTGDTVVLRTALSTVLSSVSYGTG